MAEEYQKKIREMLEGIESNWTTAEWKAFFSENDFEHPFDWTKYDFRIENEMSESPSNLQELFFMIYQYIGISCDSTKDWSSNIIQRIPSIGGEVPDLDTIKNWISQLLPEPSIIKLEFVD